ncbi:MAG: tetratricopeptide repeat protein [Planctomycetota bacterium]
MSDTPRSSRSAGGARFWPAVALFVTAIACFAASRSNGFTGWDDTVYVLENPALLAADGLRRIWTSTQSEQYYPLTFTSYWLEARLFGARAEVFLTTQILLHALNAIGVWWCLRKLGCTDLAAFLAALVWTVHPTHAMSVAWIAERKNLLAFFFAWISFASWVRWRSDARARFYGIALAAHLAALLSKTQALAFPLALFVFDLVSARKTVLESARALLPFALASVAAVAVTLSFEHRFLDPVDPRFTLPLVERGLHAATALLAYVRLTVWPVDLAPIYPLWDVSRSSFVWWVCVAILAALALALWHWRARVGARVLVGATIFVVTLAPVLGLVAYGNLALTPVSDHYLYPALLGAAILLAVAIDAVQRPRARGVLLALCAVSVPALAVQTARAIPVFRDARSLWTRSLERSPESYVAHLGLAEVERSAGNLAAARAHYRAATEIRPLWVDAFERWGAAELAAGNLDEAEAALQRALELVRENPRALLWMARVVERRGRPQAARELYARSVALDAHWLPSRVALGEIELGFARYAEAEAQFRAAVELDPRHARARLGVATALRGRGDPGAAARYLAASLALLGHDDTLANMLALVLATARDDSVRDGARAVALARTACESTAYADPVLVDTLAAAQAETGDAALAADTARRAAVLWRARGDARAADVSAARAASYAAGERLRL